jgi:hypothetical protein
MANTILTPTAVTREALRVLHQKLNFVGLDHPRLRRQLRQGGRQDRRHPQGAPAEPVHRDRTGATMAAQDTSETSVDLKVRPRRHVDMNFTSNDLTLNLDDFSERIIEPAMAVVAANIEADALTMYKDVYNQVNNTGSAATFAKVLQGRKVLVDNLAPMNDRTVVLPEHPGQRRPGRTR